MTAPALPETAAAPQEPAHVGRPRLYTRPFVGVVLVNLLSFAQWFSLQPIIPLLIVDLGGDAALTGVAYAFYSIPSLIFRPIFGQLVDRLGTRLILLAGTLSIALLAPVYLVPAMALILAIRIVHGIGWAATMTAAPALMARLAPASRRGEAAGIFDLMPSIAQVVMPAVGLLVLTGGGWLGVFGMAAGYALAAWVVSLAMLPPDRPERTTVERDGRLPFLEPAAVIPMGVTMLFMSAAPLFVVYPPLLAREQGIPVADLALYYPVYGIAMVASRLVMSRLIDRLWRPAVILVGTGLAAAALLVAASATAVGPLAVAGALYAVAIGASGPAMTAAVIDHAPPGRMGSAMGTYTLGYQFASGLGAALWGFAIQAAGFGPSYLLALVAQALLVLVVVRFRRGIDRPAGPLVRLA